MFRTFTVVDTQEAPYGHLKTGHRNHIITASLVARTAVDCSYSSSGFNWSYRRVATRSWPHDVLENLPHLERIVAPFGSTND